MAVSAEHSVRVTRPGSGASLRVDVEPGQELELGFFTDDVLFEIAGPDLQLNFDDGARVILAGFFPAMAKGDCTVALPDGTEVSGQMISESLTTSWEDFHTNAPADNRPAKDASEPEAEAGRALPFFLSDEPSGLLCHDSCGLFDESVHLPDAPDPHFTPRAAPFFRPDASSPDAPHSDGARHALPFAADGRNNGDFLRLDDLLDSARSPLPLWPDAAPSPACAAMARTLTTGTGQPPWTAEQPMPAENADGDWQFVLLRLGGFLG